MNNETGTTEQEPEALYGKVIGIVNDRSKMKTMNESFTSIGVDHVEILDGAIGIQRLESWKESVSQYFFGDMEAEMLSRYLEAVASGLIVFAAAVSSEAAEKAAELAKMQGASDVTHFGNSVITNY